MNPISYPGIVPNDISRDDAAKSERLKASISNAHPLFCYHSTLLRLKTRKSILGTYVSVEGTADNARSIMGKERTTHLLKWMELPINLAPGHMGNWITWTSPNRLQTGVKITKVKIRKLDFYTDIKN